MTTTNKSLNEPAANSLSWNTPLNANFAIIDKALGASIGVSLTGLTTYAVSVVEAQNMSLSFSGTPTVDVTVTLPTSVGGQWVIRNNTTKGLIVSSLAGGAGTTAIPSNSIRSIYCDGTNVYFADAQGIGSNTQIAFTSGGVLTGSNDLTFDGALMSLGASNAVTGASTSGSGPITATVTFSSAKVVPVGSTVIVSGVTPTAYNGVWTITGSSATSVSYTVPAALTSGSGGAVAYGTFRAGGTVVSMPNLNENRTAGVTTTAVDDGTKATGTYTPTPTGGNMRRIVNGGAFTLAAPTTAGDYTMVIQVTNSATAGAITTTGFTRVTGDAFTTTNGDDFFVYVTKCNGFSTAVVQALQ